MPLGAQLFNKRLPFTQICTQVLKLRFKFWDVHTRCVEMDEQLHPCPCQYALMRCWDNPSRGTPHWQGLEGTIFQHSWVSLGLNYSLPASYRTYLRDRTMYVFRAMTCAHLARPCRSAPLLLIIFLPASIPYIIVLQTYILVFTIG